MHNGTVQAWKRALHWVMTQPGLIEGLPGGHEPLMARDDPRLTRLLETDHTGLFQLLEGPRGHKLGIAFEALLFWGLEQGLGYQCLGRDVQIQDGKRTMGALDLVLRAPDGAIEHWELAYKLFLQCDENRGWSSWLGPRGRDRLDAKLDRMLNHQLPLSSTPQAQTTLTATLELPTIERKRIVVQGALFSPWGSPPQRAVDAHQDAQGRWLRPSSLPKLLASDPNARWIERHKPLWIGPSQEVTGITTQQMVDSIGTAPLSYPKLWSRLSDALTPTEQMLFVVAEDWGRIEEESK